MPRICLTKSAGRVQNLRVIHRKVVASHRGETESPTSTQHISTIMSSSSTCPHTNGWHYTSAGKSISNLIGVRATIDTKTPTLKCESSGATFPTHSAAFASLVFTGNYNAQSGWARYRNSPSSSIVGPKVYMEGHGPTGHTAVYGVAPTGGKEYKLEVDASTGIVSAYYDGAAQPWATMQDDAWKQTGVLAGFLGEIYVLETNMPGTSASPCNFVTCQYKQPGGFYTSVGLVSTDVQSEDTNEWGADWLSGSSFKIYDKHPL